MLHIGPLNDTLMDSFHDSHIDSDLSDAEPVQISIFQWVKRHKNRIWTLFLALIKKINPYYTIGNTCVIATASSQMAAEW